MLFSKLVFALVLISLLVEHGCCWDQSVYVDAEERVQLSWSVNNTDSTVSFSLTVLTGGWVGLGFNTRESMIGADMVLGWIKNGQTFFTVSEKRKYCITKLEALVPFSSWAQARTSKQTCNTCAFKFGKINDISEPTMGGEYKYLLRNVNHSGHNKTYWYQNVIILETSSVTKIIIAIPQMTAALEIQMNLRSWLYLQKSASFRSTSNKNSSWKVLSDAGASENRTRTPPQNKHQ